MKKLVIAEKPSVARDIARVLGCNQKNNGTIEGKSYVVTWGLGHLVTLSDPEQYNKEFQNWKIEHLPILPKHMKLEVIKQTSKQYGIVKSAIHRKDIDEIIIATDAGREGELVARWILEKADNHKPLKRLWISSVTDKAIKEGFAHLRPGKDYEPLFQAAVARAEADWLVGINATRALTCKYNAQLSCGRVQTPTLAMIAAREEEIRKFVPKPFYGLTASGKGITFTWQNSKDQSYRTFNKEEIQKILQACQKEPLTVKEVKKVPKKTYAPALYDLTELQRDANKKFGYSAKQTLNIMQNLYEHHKVLTYPRTDSRYLTTDIVPTIPERLRACATGPYKTLVSPLLKQRIVAKSSFVDNKKVSDHHAIIPTEESVPLSAFSNEERRIYDLVVKRFLAVLYPPFEYEQTTILAKAKNESFIATGKLIKQQGWKTVYGTIEEEEEDEKELSSQTLPAVTRGESFSNLTYKVKEGKTKPPAYFNEGTLLSAMENPSKYLSDSSKMASQTLKETGGLGTVATRADIIDKLFHTFLIELQGKDMRTTAKGRQLLSLVPDELKKPDLTASWEMKLSGIAQKKLKQQNFMMEIREYATILTNEIKSSSATFKHDNITNKKCPDCGKQLLLVNHKNGKMHVCQDRECGYREMLSRVTNARCPVCHKKMELTGTGEKQTFMCKCGYKERLAAFQARRSKEGAGVSKKDVLDYMQKQKKQEEAISPFAAALQNIKLK